MGIVIKYSNIRNINQILNKMQKTIVNVIGNTIQISVSKPRIDNLKQSFNLIIIPPLLCRVSNRLLTWNNSMLP